MSTKGKSKSQASKLKTSQTRMGQILTYQGKQVTLAEIAKDPSCPIKTPQGVRLRLNRGMTVDEIMNTPDMREGEKYKALGTVGTLSEFSRHPRCQISAAGPEIILGLLDRRVKNWSRYPHLTIDELFTIPVHEFKDIVHAANDMREHKPYGDLPLTIQDNVLPFFSEDALQTFKPKSPFSHNYAKLSDAQVREIKTLLREGKLQREISEQFGVSQSNISAIATGKTWAHIRVENFAESKPQIREFIFMPPKEELINKYYKQRLNINQLKAHYHTSHAELSYWLTFYEIPIRTGKTGFKGVYKAKNGKRYFDWIPMQKLKSW